MPAQPRMWTSPSPHRAALAPTLERRRRHQNALIRERLQDAAEGELHDGFAFRIGDPMADVDAAPYGGARYPIVAWRGSTIAPWRPFTWMWASATTSRRRLSGSPASISSTLPA